MIRLIYICGTLILEYFKFRIVIKMTKLQIINELLDEYFDLHIKVLRKLATGETYKEIRRYYQDEIESLDYEQFAKDFTLLSFDKEGKIRGAYPLSPKQTNYLLKVDGLGTSYAMCAVDALGVAYTFNAKTVIQTTDPISRTSIEIIIDPNEADYSQYKDYVISMPKSIVNEKKEENWDEAVDLCPQIGFFESKESIPTEQLAVIDIIPFQLALNYGKTIFDFMNLRQNLKNRFNVLLNLYDSAMTEEEMTSLFFESGESSHSESLNNHWSNQELQQQLVIGTLQNKGLIRNLKGESHYLTLTPKGRRVVDMISKRSFNEISNENRDHTCQGSLVNVAGR